jgi:hypothetical protein
MELNDFGIENMVLFSGINGILELPQHTLEKWKDQSKLEKWNGFLIFKGLEGYYHVPFDTLEEMNKSYSYYSSIDHFIGKINL